MKSAQSSFIAQYRFRIGGANFDSKRCHPYEEETLLFDGSHPREFCNNGVMSLGMGWQVPHIPGLGDVKWQKFFAALTEVRYDYVVSIEHEDRAFKGNEELVKRGFYLSRDVLKPFIH